MGLVFGPAMKDQPVWAMGEGQDPHWPVAAQDVAEFVTRAAISHPSACNRVMVITGPQPLSIMDAASVAEKILGKPVRVKTFDPATPPPELSTLTIQLMSLVPTSDLTEGTLVAREFGITLTTLDDYLGKVLATPAKAKD